MKYENFKSANDLYKKIKQAESQLEKLVSYESGGVSLLLTLNSKPMLTIGMGTDHPLHNMAKTFIEDCIQIQRDHINRLKDELTEL